MNKCNVTLTEHDLNLIKSLVEEKSDNFCIIENQTLGKIIFPYGLFGNITDKNKLFSYGFGLKHIVQARFERDKMDEVSITCLILLIYFIIKVKPLVLQSNTRFYAEYKGIKVFVDKNWYGKDETWIITGFISIDKNNKLKKEAMDEIEAVNANYHYKQQFSCIQTAVGAIIASVISIRNKLNNCNTH